MMRVAVIVVAAVVIALLLVLLAAGFIEAIISISSWLGVTHAIGIDTQSSENYGVSSGVGPMIIAAFGFSGVGVSIYKHINCEQPGCWRLGHRHPGHGRPVCRAHYHHDVAPQRNEE